ncbi:MAG: hypothetical protein HY247_05840 [archaeon]|nr:MAG: hypothetical protein HY247_05840 [archaeon]
MKSYDLRLARDTDQDDQRFSRCPDATHVLDVGGEPVVHALAYATKGILSIRMMQTRPDGERKGYGRYFVFALAQLVHAQGVSRIEAWDVGPESEVFWRKVGYRLSRVENEVEIWSKAIVPIELWIPVIGYFINLVRVPPEDRRFTVPAILTLFLIGLVGIAFTIPFAPVFPPSIAISYAIEFDLALLGVAIVIALIETGMLVRWGIERFGWARLVGKPARYVFRTFVYFNYQEMMFGALGITFLFLIHAVV